MKKIVEVRHLGSIWLLDVSRIIAIDERDGRIAFESVYWSDLSQEDFCKVKDLWIELKNA